jgi:hypothetical protein
MGRFGWPPKSEGESGAVADDENVKRRKAEKMTKNLDCIGTIEKGTPSFCYALRWQNLASFSNPIQSKSGQGCNPPHSW